MHDKKYNQFKINKISIKTNLIHNDCGAIISEIISMHNQKIRKQSDQYVKI